MFGVNLSGAEWGAAHLPGTLGQHYTFNSPRAFEYWVARGLPLIRLPFLWERLQPVLDGPLDPAHLALLRQSAQWAGAAGAKLILEPHNFARYRGHPIDDHRWLQSPPVTRHHFARFWSLTVQALAAEPAIHAWDLTNEPHHLGRGRWPEISQAAVAAIRQTGDTRLICIPGDNWSSAARWPQSNPPTPWIDDPAANIVYEAHCYFDHDFSGQYTRTYDEEQALSQDPIETIAQRRLAPFLNWCETNNAKPYLGEFAVPHDDPRWLAPLENLLAILKARNADATYWAAGEWWPDYKIGIQPQNDYAQAHPLEALLASYA